MEVFDPASTREYIYIYIYYDMRPESWNNPLPDNGSLTQVSVTTSRKDNMLGND
jgi:hypothetical protein